ncbi:MAG: FKBP-type peptidyl-prolyl cis-trans isomerase [Pseudarcicella sp.]|nr:FKBP-type peptidyl-prolyl cis-trans isomerase [Pseudarcicella sp.]MBP6409811.1 FKBP-type peptidyl-prolyl cis-trans isomerase [Pseudarcicella sp.]
MNISKFLIISGIAISPAISFGQTKKVAPAKPKPAVASPKLATKTVGGSSSLISQKDSLSYSFGVLIAQNFKTQGVDLSSKVMSAAFDDVLNGKALKMTDANANEFVQKYMSKLQEQKMAEQAKQFEPIKIAGERFLEENKKKPNIVTLPSGLQYEIIKAGEGPKPVATNTVKTHYHGTLIDGTVFDSSVDRGEPATFPVNGVIQGWVEALQLMPVGSKWKLYIPQNLAYGSRGGSELIKPYTALIFDIELLSIEK